MKLTPAELFSLFKQQASQHGLVAGFKRTLDPKVQRLESRRLLSNYIRPHHQGVEFLTSAQSIGPSHDHIETKTVDVVHVGADSGTPWVSERFEPSKIPYDDMTFDFIIAENVLPLITDRNKAVKEWFRVMNEGGHLFLFVKKEAGLPTPAELQKEFSTDRWEHLETLDPITDQDQTYAMVVRRKREKSGIIEILKMQQSNS